MKNKNNKEILKRIKDVIEQYDKMGISVDSFLISGRETGYYSSQTLRKVCSAESIYCSGYIDSESNKDPQKLIAKVQLFNESVNSLINGALGKEDNEFTKSTFLRVTGFKRDE